MPANSQFPGESDDDYATRRLREKNPFEGMVRTTDPVSPPQRQHMLGTVGEGRDKNTTSTVTQSPFVNGQPSGTNSGAAPVTVRAIVTSGASPTTGTLNVLTV